MNDEIIAEMKKKKTFDVLNKTISPNFFELNYWLITNTHVLFVIIFYVGAWMIYVYNEYAAE